MWHDEQPLATKRAWPSSTAGAASDARPAPTDAEDQAGHGDDEPDRRDDGATAHAVGRGGDEVVPAPAGGPEVDEDQRRAARRRRARTAAPSTSAASPSPLAPLARSPPCTATRAHPSSTKRPLRIWTAIVHGVDVGRHVDRRHVVTGFADLRRRDEPLLAAGPHGEPDRWRPSTRRRRPASGRAAGAGTRRRRTARRAPRATGRATATAQPPAPATDGVSADQDEDEQRHDPFHARPTPAGDRRFPNRHDGRSCVLRSGRQAPAHGGRS